MCIKEFDPWWRKTVLNNSVWYFVLFRTINTTSCSVNYTMYKTVLYIVTQRVT